MVQPFLFLKPHLLVSLQIVHHRGIALSLLHGFLFLMFAFTSLLEPSLHLLHMVPLGLLLLLLLLLQVLLISVLNLFLIMLIPSLLPSLQILNPFAITRVLILKVRLQILVDFLLIGSVPCVPVVVVIAQQVVLAQRLCIFLINHTLLLHNRFFKTFPQPELIVHLALPLGEIHHGRVQL